MRASLPTRNEKRRRAATTSAVAILAMLLAVPIAVMGPPAAHASGGSTILIVAPHPDDDLLYGAGVAASARAQGTAVKVAYLTNGDLYGVADGLVRQNEAVQGQAAIGGSEDNPMFLGYPDGYTQDLLNVDTGPTSVFTTPLGQSATYGDRGLGRSDFHTYRFGSAAAYNGANVLKDLAAIIADNRPTDIYTTGPYDQHPDHQAAYAFTRTAILSVMAADPTYAPVFHTTIVHMDDNVGGVTEWPLPTDPTTLMTEPPSFETITPLSWAARESIPVPPAMQRTDLATNPKYIAIDAHQSQGGASGYLGRFIHADEVFWIDNLPTPTPTPGPTPTPTPAGPHAHAGSHANAHAHANAHTHAHAPGRGIERRPPGGGECLVGDRLDRPARYQGGRRGYHGLPGRLHPRVGDPRRRCRQLAQPHLVGAHDARSHRPL